MIPLELVDGFLPNLQSRTQRLSLVLVTLIPFSRTKKYFSSKVKIPVHLGHVEAFSSKIRQIFC